MHHEANDGIKHAAEYYLVVIGQSYVRVNPYLENARTNGRPAVSWIPWTPEDPYSGIVSRGKVLTTSSDIIMRQKENIGCFYRRLSAKRKRGENLTAQNKELSSERGKQYGNHALQPSIADTPAGEGKPFMRGRWRRSNRILAKRWYVPHVWFNAFAKVGVAREAAYGIPPKKPLITHFGTKNALARLVASHEQKVEWTLLGSGVETNYAKNSPLSKPKLLWPEPPCSLLEHFWSSCIHISHLNYWIFIFFFTPLCVKCLILSHHIKFSISWMILKSLPCHFQALTNPHRIWWPLENGLHVLKTIVFITSPHQTWSPSESTIPLCVLIHRKLTNRSYSISLSNGNTISRYSGPLFSSTLPCLHPVV
jgi:hypothetical protein